MSNSHDELREFCSLLGIDDNTCVLLAKQRYRLFCRRFHPDKNPGDHPPPAVPGGADVYSGDVLLFTATAVPGVYKHEQHKYVVPSGSISSSIARWSVANVLARLNCIKAAALSLTPPPRSRAYAPIAFNDVVNGVELCVRYANKRKRVWSTEVLVTSPGRTPPYVMRGKNVDVLVFTREA